jgi:hypothetical protein
MTLNVNIQTWLMNNWVIQFLQWIYSNKGDCKVWKGRKLRKLTIETEPGELVADILTEQTTTIE